MDSHTMAKNVGSIFSLPDVALRVNDLVNSEEVTNVELEQTILNDPALTAKILKFANSSYFGFSGKIETVSRAISVIGHQELRTLVIATSVTSTFDGISSDLVDMETFWHHSISCGVVARLLAPKINNRERLFIAGLLHGIGKLIFYSQYPEESEKVLNLQDQSDESVANAQRKIFGFTHAELAAALLKQWQLPPSIWKIVEFQLDPLNGREFEYESCILHVAANIARCIQSHTNQETNLDEIKPTYKLEAWNHLGLNNDVIKPMITVAELQVIEMLGVIRPATTQIF